MAFSFWSLGNVSSLRDYSLRNSLAYSLHCRAGLQVCVVPCGTGLDRNTQVSKARAGPPTHGFVRASFIHRLG